MPCGAATVALRAAGEALRGNPEVDCEVRAPSEGQLSLVVGPAANSQVEWLRGITEGLIRACLLIQSEFPKALSVEIETERYDSGT